MRRDFLGLLTLGWVLLTLSPAQAVPTIISTIPPNLASGVSPSAAVVFTFSEAMNTSLTEVTFQSFIPPTTLVSHPTTAVWSGGDTVLTCTPSPAFPPNTQIIWSASGENPLGDFLDGTTGGFFMTGTGSGGGGSGTNAITTFSVGKLHSYNQTSAALPVLDPENPYFFSAVTSLASNRTATGITLTLPTAGVSNLTQNPVRPEMYFLTSFGTNLGAFDAAYPAGDYQFSVQTTPLNLQVLVNLPTTNILSQPAAPHLTNYPAAQAVDPAQAFVLGWDAFPGGTASDFIAVDIGTVYSSTNLGSVGALTGTARTFTIPAGKLSANSNYDSSISFYHFVTTTNGTNYATLASRATTTTFSLITTGGAAPSPLVLTNSAWANGAFSFDVLCTNGQTVSVEFTNVLAAGPWPKFLTTNSPGAKFHIISPQTGANPSLYFRARNGP